MGPSLKRRAVPMAARGELGRSVGGGTAGARAARSRYPQSPLLLTTATPTGRARARDLYGAAVDVRFLPYDTPGAVPARFMDRTRPRLAILMETELWPNPVPAMRAPPRAPGAGQRAAVGGEIGRALSAVRRIVSRHFLRQFVDCGSDPRGCRTLHGDRSAECQNPRRRQYQVRRASGRRRHGAGRRAARLVRRRHERFGFPAARTRAKRSGCSRRVHRQLLDECPNALLLLVPRHPDRFDAVAEQLRHGALRFTRRGGDELPDGATPIVLVDTVGELAAARHAAADVAFVGGSLVPIGRTWSAQPAALGVPVLTGPSYFAGKDIARMLIQQSAALEVQDARELAAALVRLLGDCRERQRMGAVGRRLVESNRGSVLRGCSSSLNLGCRIRRRQSGDAGCAAGASVSRLLIFSRLCWDRVPAACCNRARSSCSRSGCGSSRSAPEPRAAAIAERRPRCAVPACSCLDSVARSEVAFDSTARRSALTREISDNTPRYTDHARRARFGAPPVPLFSLAARCW